MSNKPGQWVNGMVNSVGKYFVAETSDGISRSGKITGFTWREFKFNKKKVRFPIEIEINGDPSDRLPLDRIATLDVT